MKLEKDLSCGLIDKTTAIVETLQKTYPPKVEDTNMELFAGDKAKVTITTKVRENAITTLKITFEADQKTFFSYEMWKETVDRAALLEVATMFITKQKYTDKTLFVGRGCSEVMKAMDIHKLPYGTKNSNKNMGVCGTCFENIELLENMADHAETIKHKTMKKVLDSRKEFKDFMGTLVFKNNTATNIAAMKLVKENSLTVKDYQAFANFEQKVLKNVVEDIFGKNGKLIMVGSVAMLTAIKTSTVDFTIITSMEMKKDKTFNKDELVEKIAEALKKDTSLESVEIEKQTKFNIVSIRSKLIPGMEITVSVDNLLGVEFVQLCDAVKKQHSNFVPLARLLRIWLTEAQLTVGDSRVYGTYFFDLLLLRILEKRRLIAYGEIKLTADYRRHNNNYLQKEVTYYLKVLDDDKQGDRLMLGNLFLVFFLEYAIHFPQHHGMTFPFSTALDSHTIDLSHGKLCFVKGGYTILHSAYIGDTKKYRYFVNTLIASLWKVVSFQTKTSFASVKFKFVKEDGTEGTGNAFEEYLVVEVAELKEETKEQLNFAEIKDILLNKK